ncbi:sulfate transporter [Trichoderma arundinaceum]|uniref:Sulfate transporter n=1 Tax=Trichoderma arundinaceum TaxID=490622 RepID=A0A395NMV8_TRIAR|nr:sulfate transporter [Trichoderma arundinaceum]
MARFVDLDDELGQEQPIAAWQDAGKPLALPENGTAVMVVGDGDRSVIVPTRKFPSRKSTMTEKAQQQDAGDASGLGKGKDLAVRGAMAEAFQCYPIVFGIVSHIDLNTLDALARSSRLIHDGLIQYRTSLMGATLRCSKEAVPVDPEQTLRYRARASDWNYMEDGRSYNGKSGSCARDMVAECRRCADIICRNCAIKPPLSTAMRERHRRLCVTCAKAPIAALAAPALDISLPLTSDAVQRAVCQCDTEGVWLCQPCGHSIRNADHDYKGIWRWRTKYGGFTGIGDGDRGVICGREEACLAAREREQEIDCDAEDARGSTLVPWSTGSSSGTPSPGPQHTGTPPGGAAGFPFPANGTIESIIDEIRLQRTPSPQLGPGYERHEIEGIGGIVKRKLVRMVRVGACVPEWEDEKGSGNKILAREVNGTVRSWCGWCWRVIPGEKDKRQSAK